MQRSSIHPLRQAREAKNLTLQALADAVGLSEKTIWSAEHDKPVGLYTRKKLCKYFKKTAQELGLVVDQNENHTSAENLPIQASEQQNDRADEEASLEHNQGSKSIESSSFTHSPTNTEEAAQLSSAIKDGILMAAQELGGQNLNELRRKILEITLGITIGKTSIEQIPFSSYPNTPPFTSSQAVDVSDQVIWYLAVKTKEYRDQQRNGITIEKDVRKHITDIQEALESTENQEKRRKLWAILAHSQLLVRLSITKEREMTRARTWNEAAISSAQYSGDPLLIGATIGHLAHLHLTWRHDMVSAGELLDQAHSYGKDHPSLVGWFAIVSAAIAVKNGKTQRSEDFIKQAMDVAYTVANEEGYIDAFFTDFCVTGVKAFAGNCLLKSKEPTKALEQLSSIHLENLAENRQASTLYDMSCAYAALSNLDLAQTYALQSIDKALATDRLYIIPRFISLAQHIQKKDLHEPHAAAIVEYSHKMLQQQIQ